MCIRANEESNTQRIDRKVKLIEPTEGFELRYLLHRLCTNDETCVLQSHYGFPQWSSFMEENINL